MIISPLPGFCSLLSPSRFLHPLSRACSLPLTTRPLFLFAFKIVSTFPLSPASKCTVTPDSIVHLRWSRAQCFPWPRRLHRCHHGQRCAMAMLKCVFSLLGRCVDADAAQLCERSYGSVSFVGAHDSYAVGATSNCQPLLSNPLRFPLTRVCSVCESGS